MEKGNFLHAQAPMSAIILHAVNYHLKVLKNHNHFIQAKGGGYTCHSCGHYVQKEYYGAMKILEFDIDTNYITAYHYGNHICWPKPNIKQQLQYAEDATLN